MNWTLMESTRAMVTEAGLPKKFWGDAILHVAHIVNRVPTRALKQHITPFEAYTGNKPSIAHLQVFGCKAHVHVPDEQRKKLNVKSLECVHLGYAEHRKAYVCLQRSSGRVVESRDIMFDELNDGQLTHINIRVEDEPGQPEHTPKTIPNVDASGDSNEVHVEDILDGESPEADREESDIDEGTGFTMEETLISVDKRKASQQNAKPTLTRRSERSIPLGPPAPYPHPIPSRKIR